MTSGLKPEVINQIDTFIIIIGFRDAFRIFDRNRDGYIDMAELRKMFAMVGGVFSREEMEEFMEEADKAISDILIIYL